MADASTVSPAEARAARQELDRQQDRAERQREKAATQQAALDRSQEAANKEAKRASAATRKQALDLLKQTRTGQFAKDFSKRLLTLIELGGVAGLIYLLRKPLERFALHIAYDIYRYGKVIKNGLKEVAGKVGDEIETVELKTRVAIVERYLKDPILMHKIGPNLYNELTAAQWTEKIHTPGSSYPSEVSDTFTAGTGAGAEDLRGQIVWGVSVQIFALIKWFTGNSMDLQRAGDFPQLAPARA